MDYSIKCAAQLLGISNNGVRFLEKKGMVTPHYNDESGYRCYDYDDLVLLFFYKTYKNEDLGLSEIREALHDSPEQVSLMLDAHLNALKTQLVDIEHKIASTQILLERVSYDPICNFEDRPHAAFLDSENDLFKQINKPNPKNDAFVRAWFDRAPLQTCAIRYELDTNGKCIESMRGSYACWDELAGNGLENDSHLRDYPPEPQCFHVSLSYPNTKSDDEELHALLDLLATHVPGAIACGTIIGRLLHVQLADKGIIYFAEYWIPFTKKEND